MKGPKKPKLVLYKRVNSKGQNVGFGWHSPAGAKALRKEGYKLTPAKK